MRSSLSVANFLDRLVSVAKKRPDYSIISSHQAMKNRFLITAATTLFAIGSASATTIINGSVSTFTGPDDLLLDPATSVIAVDIGGDSGDQLVNGVNFQADGTGVTGSVTNGLVTVASASTHSINGWANATPPAYVGANPVSVDNLERIMHDIRWSLNPANISIDITGLTSGQLYSVQLLFSENGSASNRRWDIGVDGILAVDDYSTNGTTLSVGSVYSGVFDPGGDGTLNILMGIDPLPGDPNNTVAGPAPPEDHNPILNGVIIHTVPEPVSAALIGLGLFSMLLTRRRRK
jgi:hypothetical protein